MTDLQLAEVDCGACRHRHLLGVPAGHTGPIDAWCPRSARTYVVELQEQR